MASVTKCEKSICCSRLCLVRLLLFATLLYMFYNVRRMKQEREKNEAKNNNSNNSNNNKKHLPLARGFVSSFSTMLSYAISSATPESLTSFSLTAIQILFFANKSSSSSYACVIVRTGMRQQSLMVVWCVHVGACVCVSNERREQKKTENYFKHIHGHRHSVSILRALKYIESWCDFVPFFTLKNWTEKKNTYEPNNNNNRNGHVSHIYVRTETTFISPPIEQFWCAKLLQRST